MRVGIYLLALIILGALILFIFFQIISTTTSSGTLSVASKQQFVESGGIIDVGFLIYNDEEYAQNYTYLLFLNDENVLEDRVTINPKDSFSFGGYFRENGSRRVKVTAELYAGKKEALLDKVTYYLAVKSEK